MMSSIQAIRAELQGIADDPNLTKSEKADLLAEVIQEVRDVAENLLYHLHESA